MYVMFHGKGTLQMELKLRTVNREIVLDNPHGPNVNTWVLKSEGRSVNQIDETEKEARDIQSIRDT